MTPMQKKNIGLVSIVILVGVVFIGLRGRLLSVASERGYFVVVKVLVALGADVDAPDGEYSSKIPLHCAISGHRFDIAGFLISKGASIQRRNASGESAFNLVVDHADGENFDEEGLSFLDELLKSGADINSRDQEGRTALMGVWSDSITSFLLEKGADPNLRDKDGNTVLHLKFYNEAIPLLLKYGADPNAKNNSGETPLHYLVNHAGWRVNSKILKNFDLMIQAGLDPRARDSSGNLAVTKAIEDGMDDLIALLERHDAGEEMTPELEAARDSELAGMLFRRMHALRRASGCEVTLRNGEQMVGHGQSIFGVKGETVEAWGQCPSGGVLHGVVYGNGKVFHQFLNLDAGLGGFKPLSGFQGPVAFTVTPDMEQAEVAWVVTEQPAVSIRKVLEQASAALASKQRVKVGRRGN